MGAHDTATIVLEADASQVAAARRFVRGCLSDRVDPDMAGDLQLIVSELFTNAIEHGNAETVTVDIEQTATAVGVTVHSAGSSAGVGALADWSVAEPTEITGRGLGIVRQLADEIVIDRERGAFVVTAWRTLRARADA